MGKRGKIPNGKISVVDPIIHDHPKPLTGMTAPAKKIWKKIVEAYYWDFFRDQHFELLRVYCEAAASHKKACKEIQKNGSVIIQDNGIQKRSLYCQERDACASTMCQAGTKLGIHRNATIATREHGGAGETPKEKSKWDGLLWTPTMEAENRAEYKKQAKNAQK